MGCVSVILPSVISYIYYVDYTHDADPQSPGVLCQYTLSLIVNPTLLGTV